LVSLAAICRGDGDIDEAIRLYRRALALNFGHYDWHYQLAALVAQKGLVDEAIHEARICLRLEPNYEPARKLMAELSLRTERVEEKPEPM
jgi:tetratricopeptide (TPR) repeat protein